MLNWKKIILEILKSFHLGGAKPYIDWYNNYAGILSVIQIREDLMECKTTCILRYWQSLRSFLSY